MDKTSRLIRWQRIMIVVLFLGLITTGSYAYVYVYRCRLHATKILLLRDMQKTDHNTIHDQGVRLKWYEARLNQVDPMRCLFLVRSEVGVDPLDGPYDEAAHILSREGIDFIAINQSFHVRSSDFTRSKSILLKAKRFQMYRASVMFDGAGTHR